MAERNKHLFTFTAAQIAKAAKAEQEYHRSRRDYWGRELELAAKVVQETAGAKVEKQSHTNGWVYAVVVNYGDPAMYKRMTDASYKVQEHQKAYERFASDCDLYGTQGKKKYELDAEDVAHFRFNGRQRVE